MGIIQTNGDEEISAAELKFKVYKCKKCEGISNFVGVNIHWDFSLTGYFDQSISRKYCGICIIKSCDELFGQLEEVKEND